MRTKIYEAYGCIGNAEIFVGSDESFQIAEVIANNNLGSLKYMSVVIYEVVKEDMDILSKTVIKRLHGKQ